MKPDQTNPLTVRLSLLASLVWLVGCDPRVESGDWDNPFDPDGSNYHPPTIGLRDTAIKEGATGRVQGLVSKQVAEVESCHWTFDGQALETRECSLPTALWNAGNHVVTIRATDARGVTSPTTTANVWIGNLPPKLTPLPNTQLGTSRGFTAALQAEDHDGAITKIAWDLVPGRYAVATSQVQILSDPAGGSQTLYWMAIDNDGDTTKSETEVRFIPPPRVTVTPSTRSSGWMTGMNGHWTVYMYGQNAKAENFSVLVELEIPNFPEEPIGPVSVTSSYGKLDCEAAYPGSPNRTGKISLFCPERAGASWSSSSIDATAQNRFGETGSASITVQLR